jgi:spermidine/putrescine transport system permease protein
LWVFVAVAGLVLLLPILTMLVYSLNAPVGRYNYSLNAFSLNAWRHPFSVPQLSEALTTTLIIASSTAAICTLLGTPMALAMARFRFRGRSGINIGVFIPLATPEIILASGLLTLFVVLGTSEPFRAIIPSGVVFPLGKTSLLIGHVTLCLSIVVVTVRARVLSFPADLHEAASDLGAGPWAAFRTVTFPLIRAGIAAGAMFAFVASLDDFVVSNFLAGQSVVYPTWLYGLIRRSLPPQIDVVGVLMFVVAVATVAAGTWLATSRGSRTGYRRAMVGGD